MEGGQRECAYDWGCWHELSRGRVSDLEPANLEGPELSVPFNLRCDLRNPGKVKSKNLGIVIKTPRPATGGLGGGLTVIGVSTSTGLTVLAEYIGLDFRIIEQTQVMVLRIDFV